MRNTLAFFSLLALSATPAFAEADPGFLPTAEEIIKNNDSNKKQGWLPKLQIGASFSLSSNSNFIGQVDGNSITFGGSIAGRLNYLKEEIDWRNTLNIDEVFSLTPAVDELVKTIDQLYFESVLYLRYSEVVGPFASFKLDTAMLPGRDVRAEKVDYFLNGEEVATGVHSTRLTNPFQPLQLKEAIGAFYTPISMTELDLGFRAGFGFSQTFAEGAKIVDEGASADNIIALTTLKDVLQAGAVLGLEASGEFDKGRIAYSARAEVMFPFVNDDPEKRNTLDLTNVDINAKVGFKMFEWASLNYELKVLRLPQLLDEWQVQNNLLLTFSYTVVDDD